MICQTRNLSAAHDGLRIAISPEDLQRLQIALCRGAPLTNELVFGRISQLRSDQEHLISQLLLIGANDT